MATPVGALLRRRAVPLTSMRNPGGHANLCDVSLKVLPSGWRVLRGTRDCRIAGSSTGPKTPLSPLRLRNIRIMLNKPRPEGGYSGP